MIAGAGTAHVEDSVGMSPQFFIGWDVGGWNCDTNSKSRDAIVILDESLTIVGKPWRGNLRETINAAVTTTEWTASLFRLCGSEGDKNVTVTLAIDTPLGFSTEFLALASDLQASGSIGDSPSNQYLYRHTERRLFKGKKGPLSAIKDMIGSQATKGMHVLAKFAPQIESCGVWTDGANLWAIETYPAACQNAQVIKRLLKARNRLAHDDLDDARICALVAHLFATRRSSLDEPSNDVPLREGWIWLPQQESS